ncbi:alpha-hydroxy acid oxidase [Rhodococcoides fascians]|uniref:alpha-hydroxy acid oxidase n=1 Tax=Rhodococcoides fascians TaxID=1828 RepID=UPI00068B4230|nr:alpha-hydroxy acid oxidase [Rhodococcus fascians]
MSVDATSTRHPAEATPVPTAGAPFATLGEAFDIARDRLSSEVWDFVSGGAGDETTLQDNRTEFSRWLFCPRTMSGLSMPSTTTSLLGMELDLPVLTAPFGTDGLFDAEGHRAVARADARQGALSIVPEAGTFSLEDVRDAAPSAARIAQVHPMGDPRNFQRMLERIANAGYSAICVTVDCPTGGWRERNLRNRFEIEPRVISGNYPGSDSDELSEVFGQIFARNADVWSWEELAEAMRHTALPWIAKGILTAEDARRAVDAGAAAVMVSNHGGRQLDGAPSALAQLPEVVAAVGRDIEVILDSGIRRGSDVVKAVALGAKAVVIGRLAVVALAAAGENGVEHALRLLKEEIITVLTLVGRGSIAELNSDAVTRRVP